MIKKISYKTIGLLFTVIALILNFLPVKETFEINNQKYMLGNTSNLSDNQIDPNNSGGVNNTVWSTDKVSVSKTIDGTDTEDYFDITLQVKTKKPVTEYLDNEAAAVVLVIDLSNTMLSDFNGNPEVAYNSSKAKKAADSAGIFVDKFYQSSADFPNNAIGAVGFNTNGVSLVGMTKLTSTTKRDNFKGTLSTKIQNTVQSYTGANAENKYTNIEAGLQMAKDMLANCTQRYKFIVFISDGLPTTYIQSGYTGVPVKTLKDGLNNKRVLLYGGNYSDTGAKRARKVAKQLKDSGVTIYSIGVGLSTFKGTPDHSGEKDSNGNSLPYITHIPFGGKNVFKKLNGEKFLINQLARSVMSDISTIENTFSNITSQHVGESYWNTYKSRIYNLDWEIRNNYNPATMQTTPKYVLSETPPSSQPALFENWLQYGIGSGFYYDVTDPAGLTKAIENIHSHLNTDIINQRAIIWTTSDPMYDQNYNLKEYIEFIGFYYPSDTSNPLSSSNYTKQSLSKAAGEINTASINKTTSVPDGTINWDLKNSDYTVSGNTYIYTLKYRIRLKTDKEGFKKDTYYKTNGKTTLTYVIEKDGKTEGPKYLDYPIPAVKGFLTDIKVSKTVEGEDPDLPFNDENKKFSFSVSLKRADGTSATKDYINGFPYKKQTAAGNVQGYIKDGDTFTLENGETIEILNLYHDIDWKIIENKKSGFAPSITSISCATSENPDVNVSCSSSGREANGTTLSKIPKNIVNYNNKSYYLKMKKVDKIHPDKVLGNVEFGLYSTRLENGEFQDPVTNLHGDSLGSIITDENGMIDFGNLPFDYENTTTYYLVEKATINSYSLLDNYVVISVTKNGISASYDDPNIEKPKQTSSGYMLEVEVPNAAIGIDLPETGGPGSLKYTTLGLLLMLISEIAYFTDKKLIRKWRNKIMKKYLGILFMFLVSFCMLGNVNAETYNITVDNAVTGHTYEAYQIFTGDIDSTKALLSNIVWGSNIKSDFAAANDAFTYANIIKNAPETSAKVLGTTALTGTPAGTGVFEEGVCTIKNLTPGYYLIKDKEGSIASGQNDSYTAYIVKLLSQDVNISLKIGLPTVDKKIAEESEVTSSAKYAVGDKVTYKLIGTMPSNYSSYETYKYIFHDTLSDGLTYDSTTEVIVKVDNTTIDPSYYTVTPNGQKIDIAFADTKLIKNANNEPLVTEESTITVEYAAIVNENAVRGNTGNKNTLNIEFSNNPYTNETGTTTNVETKVYLFDIILNKVDEEGHALEGAQFKLERQNDDGTWTTWTIASVDGNKFTFGGLAEGTYKLTETTTPDGYNTMSPVTFTITATIEEDVLTNLESTGFSFEEISLSAGTLTRDIVNIKGVELPLTGGIGTTIFTLVGLSLMGIAVIGILRNKEEK